MSLIDPHEPTRRRGVVAVIVRDARLLVIRRSHLVVAPGAFCFPGGGIESDETEEQALARELREELDVAVAPRRRLWRSVTKTNVDLAWWLAELPTAQVPIPTPAEVESCHWLTTDEMLALPELLDSNRKFLAALAQGVFRLA